MNSAAINTDRLSKAFDLVCPAKHAARRVAAGQLSAAEAAKIDWKSRISAAVTQTALDRAGVTIDDVAEAVAFYTATVATVEKKLIHFAKWHDGHEAGRCVLAYRVIADGYRKGPAGDH